MLSQRSCDAEAIGVKHAFYAIIFNGVTHYTGKIFFSITIYGGVGERYTFYMQ